MEEKAKLYWTAKGKRAKIGLITLTDKGITIYKKAKKLIFLTGDLRSEVFTEFGFKDIINVTMAKRYLTVLSLNIFVTEKAYDEKYSKIKYRNVDKSNTERKLAFWVNADAKEEVQQFADLANEAVQNARSST